VQNRSEIRFRRVIWTVILTDTLMENSNGIFKRLLRWWPWFLTLLSHRFDPSRLLGVAVLGHHGSTAHRP
jgi:hypothetical protein